MPGASPSRRDRLLPPRLGARQREAVRLVEDLLGLTVAGLAHLLGVPIGRACAIVERLEQLGQLRREPPAPPSTSRRTRSAGI